MRTGIGHVILLVEGAATERTLENITRLGVEILSLLQDSSRGPSG